VIRALFDRIMAWFGYYRTEREYPRVSNGLEAIARGQRWEAFYTEQDGLRDMILDIRRGYFEKVGTLAPGDTDSLQMLGAADRIAREIDRKVQSIIETGHMRASDREHVNKIATIRR